MRGLEDAAAMMSWPEGAGWESTKLVGAEVSSRVDPNQLARAKRAAAKATDLRLDSTFDMMNLLFRGTYECLRVGPKFYS
jgi:hypothetical protein